MLKNVLIRLCFPIENLSGQSYDGASNMSIDILVTTSILDKMVYRR